MRAEQKRDFKEYLTLVFLKDREVSKSVFNFVIGLVILWGVVVNYWIVKFFPTEWLNALNPWLFIILYLLFAFLGGFIVVYYDQPLFSFLGYTILSSTIGFLLNLSLQSFSGEQIIIAAQYTAWTTFGMIVAATLFPRLFKHLYTVLLVVVSSILVIEFCSVMFFGLHGEVFDWVVAGTMCGYIGYHWVEAQRTGDTLDNAIDFGAVLYLAIINLFLRILQILRLYDQSK